MTLPAGNTLAAARRASAELADRSTPFIYDEWYVAAFAGEVASDLLSRKLLERNILLFRTSSGEVVALDDRCAHRSFPLSQGQRDGDTIICGYHGFRYDANGDCIEVPAMTVCPKSIGVRRYPLVEKGPLLWIWMGDPELAATAPIPDTSFLSSPDWETSQGYLHLSGNYVSLHENLLDLTHLSYVHAKTFGTPEYARAPYLTELNDGHYLVRREVIPTILPPVWAEPSGLAGIKTAARVAQSEYLSPGYHRVSTSFFDTAVPEDEREVSSIRTAHLPTPESSGSTHYFIVHARDFALGSGAVTQTMHDRLFAAFREDVVALEHLERRLVETPASEFYEISVATDAPSVAMRRHLLKRAMAPKCRGNEQ